MPASHFEESDSNDDPESKVAGLRHELSSLMSANSLEAAKYESKNWFQGLGLVLIVSFFTIFGAIIGFGFFSIFTGIGGFVLGLKIAGAVLGSSSGQSEYEERKVRIHEIERILGQLD